MEIKVDSGTVSLSCQDTAEDLLQAISAIAKRYGDVSGSRDGASDLPLFHGLAWAFVNTNGVPEVCVRAAHGWVVCSIPPSQRLAALEAFRAVVKP